MRVCKKEEEIERREGGVESYRVRDKERERVRRIRE
jgi:hypothetical protein